MADNRTLRELATPNTNQQPLCITYPNAEGGFELKFGMIHYLPKFHGFSTEDANKHLMEFHVVCSRMRPANMDEEKVKLRAFPFTLEAKAKEWLYNLPPGSMNTWNQYFYEGLCGTDRVMLDAAIGGAFMDKTPTNAKALLKNIAGNTQQFGGRDELPLKKVNESRMQKRARKDTNEQGELQTKNLEQDKASIETEKSHKVIALNTKDFDKVSKEVQNSFNSCVPIPFAGRFMKSKKEQTDKEILDTFRKIQVNLPLLDAIKQVPKYAKFLKELCTNKRRFNDQETVALSEEMSIVLQSKLPSKLKDAGSFTIPCVIGRKEFGRSLCDLGASINLMPYSMYKSLNLGALKETKVVIQLADRSNRYPKGLLEDVLVQVNELIFPADFFVLEMEHDSMLTALPLILRRPFLRTARTKIDVYDGTLTMEIDGENVKFRIFNAIRYPSDLESCLSINVFDYFVHDCFNEGVGEDNLENASAPKLKLKPIPEHLKYAFLGEDETLPIIISSQLIAEKREKLIRVLKNHKTSIAWSIAYIKGINPATCMHRILLEEGAKATREAQRRLNPLMIEVIKKEVIKLLDVGIIYLISDSKWVSLVQVVLKRSRVIVIKNEANELVSTHVQNSWKVCTDYRKINSTTRKDHFPVSFIDQMLEREVRSFLGHAGFYRRFMKDFSMISIPLCRLLQKDVTFDMNEECVVAFNKLKDLLSMAPVIMPPDWSLPFELICDASDYTVSADLGQHVNKVPHVNYYASNTQ
ncbi:unnamed protein product [Malus baccata var. baccata]